MHSSEARVCQASLSDFTRNGQASLRLHRLAALPADHAAPGAMIDALRAAHAAAPPKLVKVLAESTFMQAGGVPGVQKFWN